MEDVVYVFITKEELQTLIEDSCRTVSTLARDIAHLKDKDKLKHSMKRCIALIERLEELEKEEAQPIQTGLGQADGLPL